MESENDNLATWLARAAVGIVFAVNIWCALSFILHPQAYSGNFELTGLTGEIVVQSFGILFLMWNATYPPVILRPNAHRTLFSIILVQQCIGLAGETWLLFKLPAGYPVLYSTGLRFAIFDGLGLVMMGASFIYLMASARLNTREGS